MEINFGILFQIENLKIYSNSLMKSPPPWKTHVKLLLSDKFDQNTYSSKRQSFFLSLRDHLQKGNKAPDRSKIKKKGSFVDANEILTAIEKIIPLLKDKDFSSDLASYIDYDFAVLLHYDTNEDIRRKAFTIFLKILSIIPDHFHNYNYSFRAIIPWIRFARNEPEKNNLALNLQVPPLYQEEVAPGTTDDAINQFDQFLNFLQEFFEQKKDLPEITFIYIVSILYSPLCSSFINRIESGFSNPPVPSLHLSFLKFLSKLKNMKLLF